MGAKWIAFLLVLVPCWSQKPETVEGQLPIFGTTVFSSTGLTGEIYYLKRGTDALPNFKKLKSQGQVYTTRLEITPRVFYDGFPGVTDRFEWFAIVYTGKFHINVPGRYEFALTSDDGSTLHIDNKKIVDNDGTHPPETQTGSVKLTEGTHTIKVSYFQGPRAHVALVLAVVAPEGGLKIFDTKDFMPPRPKEGQ